MSVNTSDHFLSFAFWIIRARSTGTHRETRRFVFWIVRSFQELFMRFLRILQESLKKTCCFLEGAPDSAQQQARCCCAVFILEMDLHMQFILNQDGELIITDEAEEAFDLDETDE